MAKPSKNLKKYLIKTADAIKMQNRYKKRQYKILSDAEEFPETETIWYPIEVLREYLDYVEQEAEKLNEEVTGIKFYFSAYPKGKEKICKPKNRLALTAFPTVSKGKDEEDSTIKSCPHLAHDSFYIDSSRRKKKRVKLLKTLKKEEMIFNQNTALGSGGPYPPPPPWG